MGSGRAIHLEANMGHLADVQPKRVCKLCYRGGSLWRGGLPGEPGTEPTMPGFPFLALNLSALLQVLSPPFLVLQEENRLTPLP